MKKSIILNIISSFVVSLLFTFIAWSGVLSTPDGVFSDAVYQHEKATDGEIVVIGIDQRALDEIGPLPWNRSIIADCVGFLNSSENPPAVIGLDVLYIGESDDAYADSYLAEVCRQGGNVVTAAAATFGSELVDEGDTFYMNDKSILAFDKPFDALSNNSEVGHINTMTDNDGIVRHGLLYEEPEKEKVYSFSRIIYEKYCENKGIEKNNLPETIDGFFYIPYSAKGGGYYDFISVSDLYYQTVSPDMFSGKIVLIGPYAAGLQDEYRTAIDHAVTMYGVEIQANLVDVFRKGFYPRAVNSYLQLILIFVICLILAIYFHDRKIHLSVIYEAAIVLCYPVLCFALYRSWGLVFNVLYIPLFVSILFFASVASNYMHARREKKLVENTFGHYVDKTIMKQLLQEGTSALELGGKTYDIAVLFVDIRGFTTMSEALDPPTVVEIINSYLTLTTECIMKNHGTLDKFVGDCTMAFWNAPFPQEDPVYLACCAAMDMVERSKVLGEKLEERFGRSVSFGVGVNWGPAVVGNIGAPLRMDYTAIGDTVNTAARLEANAPGGKVFISRAVADALGERAKVTSLGDSIKLKGKADGFEILTLDELTR